MPITSKTEYHPDRTCQVIENLLPIKLPSLSRHPLQQDWGPSGLSPKKDLPKDLRKNSLVPYSRKTCYTGENQVVRE